MANIETLESKLPPEVVEQLLKADSHHRRCIARTGIMDGVNGEFRHYCDFLKELDPVAYESLALDIDVNSGLMTDVYFRKMVSFEFSMSDFNKRKEKPVLPGCYALFIASDPIKAKMYVKSNHDARTKLVGWQSGLCAAFFEGDDDTHVKKAMKKFDAYVVVPHSFGKSFSELHNVAIEKLSHKARTNLVNLIAENMPVPDEMMAKYVHIMDAYRKHSKKFV